MNPTSDAADTQQRPLPWRAVGVLAVVAVVFAVGFVFRDELKPTLDSLAAWISELGPWGPVAYVGIYILWTVLGLPGTIITVIAGSLFADRPIVALVTVSCGSTIGASVCFLIARLFARKSISEWVRGSDRFAKLDEMTDSHGEWMVAITRLVPLFPFNLLNYGFGLTRISFWKYVVFSWLFMLPGTAMFVFAGSGIVQGVRDGRVPWGVVGLVVGAVAIAVTAGLVARGKLRQWSESPEESVDANRRDHSGVE